MARRGNNGDRIIRNTAFLYVRMLLLMCVSLFASRIVLRNLGVTDFGIYNLVGGFASMLVFFRSSLANATQRCLSVELGKNDIDGAVSVFRLHQTLYIFIALIVLAVAETAGLWVVCRKLVIPPERMNAAIWVYHFTVLSCCLTILNVVYDAVIIAHEHMKIYSYAGIFEGGGKLAIACAAGLFSSDRLVAYAFLFFLLTLCTRIFYASFCRWKYEYCTYRFAWDGKRAREICSFIGWNTIGTFFYSLNSQGINILLNIFFGPAVNAARGISYQINGAVVNFSTNFFTAVRPQIVKACACGDSRYLLDLFFRSSKYSVFLLWFFCLPAMLCIEPILSVWLTEVPDYTAVFTIWILAHSMVYVLDHPMWTVVLAVGRLKRYILTGNAVLVLAFPLSCIALKRGCSPASVFQILFAVRILYAGAVLSVIRRYVSFPLKRYAAQVIKPSLVVVGGSGGAGLLLSRLLPPTTAGYSLLCCGCMIAVLSLIRMSGMTDDEKELFRRTIRTAVRTMHRGAGGKC